MALPFLPITRGEIERLGWSQVDVVLITGDAYVDHPSFGAAVIGRVLEREGYRVAILAAPAWRDPDAVKVFGKPRLFFGVTSGNVDSMISRYTAFKKVRNDDPYAPGGKGGGRPERAVIVYCNMIKAAYKDVPIVLGGIEASMRRFAHYDFWDNRVRRSILEDARADILVYGMGERQIAEIASRVETGGALSGIPGTVELTRKVPHNAMLLPDEEDVLSDKDAFLRFNGDFYRNQRLTLAQSAGGRYIVQHPAPVIDSTALDDVYALPFARRPHPLYGNDVIPAFEMIRNSVTSHRGCVSGCAFCSLSLHQGRRIVPRSAGSILREIDGLRAMEYFRGHVTDIGGPSANMYGAVCRANWRCSRESCLYPDVCKNLGIHTDAWVRLLGRALEIQGVRHVTVGSGIRYDLLMRDDEKYLLELMRRHVSGYLKIAPEHTSERVLGAMRKTPVYPLEKFAERFERNKRALGKKMYILPYLMSCHPGCSQSDMSGLRATMLSIFGSIPEQVQAFIPLPMTLSSVQFYTGVDPLTGDEVFVERDGAKRRMQHAVLTKKGPENRH